MSRTGLLKALHSAETYIVRTQQYARAHYGRRPDAWPSHLRERFDALKAEAKQYRRVLAGRAAS